MWDRFSVIKGIFLAIFVSILAGCSTFDGGGGDVAEYSTLGTVDGIEAERFGYSIFGRNLSGFDSVLVESFSIQSHSDHDQKFYNPREFNRVAGELRARILNVVSRSYKVVTERGPGVLVIRGQVSRMIPIELRYLKGASGDRLEVPIDTRDMRLEFAFIDGGSSTKNARMAESAQGVGLPPKIDDLRQVFEPFSQFAERFGRVISQAGGLYTPAS